MVSASWTRQSRQISTVFCPQGPLDYYMQVFYGRYECKRRGCRTSVAAVPRSALSHTSNGGKAWVYQTSNSAVRPWLQCPSPVFHMDISKSQFHQTVCSDARLEAVALTGVIWIAKTSVPEALTTLLESVREEARLILFVLYSLYPIIDRMKRTSARWCGALRWS